ncbi:MAG: transcriptional regulator, domain linked with LysR-type domain [Firmicutes bacterium]|nr:transcriptional regulator, domain linked with LysR-type domain [Bacillota bacterium]
MNKTLRILILEDMAADAELMEDELNQAGLDFVSKRVATKADFVKQMDEYMPDLILSDYSLPGFSGKSALNIVLNQYPDIPFIFVSGALGEELAVELMKKGATDYVLKDNLLRLAPSVNRALNELNLRSERKKAEEDLKRSESELQMKSKILEEANIALKVLLKHREEDKINLEENILSNVKTLIFPSIEKLKNLKLTETQLTHVNIIESHLKEVISPFLNNLSTKHYDFTPRELEIAALVKEGRTTKEMTEYLNISAMAVDFHRKNIRLKLGIKNMKTNLRSMLLSMSS